MLDNIFKIFKKVLKNKNFTYFIALFSLSFICFILSAPDSDIIQSLVFIFNFDLIKVLYLILSLIVSTFNLTLGLIGILIFSVIVNTKLIEPEYFSNIPNLVDKADILSYNKNFDKPIKPTTSKKEEKKEKEANDEEKETNSKVKKTNYAISVERHNELKGIGETSEKNNVAEINLEEEDDTIEKELKSRYTNDIKKLEEYDSSSSESSDSASSESSTDSSDSEEEIKETSMEMAREHMLNKLRNGIKKRYIND